MSYGAHARYGLRTLRVVLPCGDAPVVAQGYEAGGHRGTFFGQAEDAFVGTLALVPQLADRLRVPVIAAAGIMDGRGVVREAEEARTSLEGSRR